jgi:DNA-binding MarR family transcriptional regulator
MSAEPLVLACQLEDLKQLDNKPFHKYARGYLEVINRNLSSAEFRIYTYLKEQSLKNYNQGGVVIQSAYEIAKGVDRSPRTAEKHLSALRTKGYIATKLHKADLPKGYFRRNTFSLSKYS